MGLPPGPRLVLPWLARYVVSPYRMFSALTRRYGDPVFLRVPDSPGTVATGHPDGVKAIISADSKTLVPWRIPATVELLTEHSIFLQAGDAHRTLRRQLAPCFQPSRHHHDVATMVSVVDAELAAQPSGPVAMQTLAQRITLHIILAALFGIRGGPRAARFLDAAQRAFDDTNPLYLFAHRLQRRFGREFGAFARVRDALEQLKTLVQAELELRRAAQAGGEEEAVPDIAPDMLAMLMAARRPDGTPLSDREIQVHLSDMIVAGHETTTVAIAWTIYELCRHPAVMARLAGELDAAGAPRDLASLARLPYLEAVCSEALRLHPPLAFLTRQVARPLDVHGYVVPPGHGVSLMLPLVHTDPATYAEPRAFRPERFLARSYGPEQFLPFGGGAKRCLGATFAMQEMMVVVGGLVARFGIRLLRDRPIRARARTITVAPVTGVEVVLARRQAPAPAAVTPPPVTPPDDRGGPAPASGRCPR